MSSRERMTKVLGCLVLSVTVGAIVLGLLQPEPLMEVTAFSLSAAFNPISQIYQTRVPVAGTRWNYVVIHQSGSVEGNAQTIAEEGMRQRRGDAGHHFVINNGRGAPDGRIQVSQVWVEQKSGARRREGLAINVCLVGDFGRRGPGKTQMSQLLALVRSLQQRCGIPAGNICLANFRDIGLGQWRMFPLKELRENLLTEDL